MGNELRYTIFYFDGQDRHCASFSDHRLVYGFCQKIAKVGYVECVNVTAEDGALIESFVPEGTERIPF